MVVGVVAQLMLTACDIGPHPLFAGRYCSDSLTSPLAAEQARERDLRDRLHEAQLAINRFPVCLPSPEHRAEIAFTPTPTPSATPTTLPTPDERLTIPRNVNDLNGCWQSIQGDIPATADDKSHRIMGHRRICYRFSGNGGGEVHEIFLEGGSCAGPLKVRLSRGRLIIRHEKLPCTDVPDGRSIVPTDITCSKKPDADFASCDRITRMQPGSVLYVFSL